AITRDSGLAERHQKLSIRTELENLVTLSVFVGIFPVGSFSVSYPDVSFTIDMDPVRTNEHPSTKTLHEFSRCIELENGRHIRSCAILSAASLKDPDVGPVAVDRDPGGRSDLPSFGKLEI